MLLVVENEAISRVLERQREGKKETRQRMRKHEGEKKRINP